MGAKVSSDPTAPIPRQSEPLTVAVGQTWELRIGPHSISYEVYEVDGDWVGLRDKRPGHDSQAALAADAGSVRRMTDASSDWFLVTEAGGR